MKSSHNTSPSENGNTIKSITPLRKESSFHPSRNVIIWIKTPAFNVLIKTFCPIGFRINFPAYRNEFQIIWFTEIVFAFTDSQRFCFSRQRFFVRLWRELLLKIVCAVCSCGFPLNGDWVLLKSPLSFKGEGGGGGVNIYIDTYPPFNCTCTLFFFFLFFLNLFGRSFCFRTSIFFFSDKRIYSCPRFYFLYCE